MRLPNRKPGKFAFEKKDAHMTKAKYDELKNQLEKLKKVSRPRAAKEVKRLALMGDFSENAAYQIAKGKLRGINRRILELEDLIKRAEIIKPAGGGKDVQAGNTVTVEIKGKQRKFRILGSQETNPSSGVISHISPLGQALLGKKVGDTVSVDISGKTIEYKIIKIE